MLVSPSRAHHNTVQCAVASGPSRRPAEASSALVGPLPWQRSHALGSDWPRCAHSAVETRLRSNGATCWSASTACLGRQVHRPGDQLASSCVAPAAATSLAACSTAQPPCGDAQRSSAHRRLAEMQEKFVLSCKRGEPGRLTASVTGLDVLRCSITLPCDGVVLMTVT